MEISVERKRKKKRQLVHGISSLSPQFCLICPARTSSKINSCMFARVRVLRVQFFYALNSCHAISLLPLFPPIFSDGISLLHFALVHCTRGIGLIADGWRDGWEEGGCRIGRRIREIAGTMDSLASTVYFRNVPLSSKRGEI